MQRALAFALETAVYKHIPDSALTAIFARFQNFTRLHFSMTLYNRINNIAGWLVFIVALAVYALTAEPTGSFWDCGEFISCAYKLQVAHSPGAPFFLIVGRIFTMFAGDPSNVAFTMNFMSNVMTALVSLFLFWTITMLARKIIGKKEADLSVAEIVAIIGSGLVGALACTFTDSNWFSAVEGEVYAMSAAFTAFVVWAIFKWDNIADHKYSDRWLLLIAYSMGLSIGVHLLNLLAIPAMVFVYYFRKYPYSRTGMVKTFFLSVLILAGIQYGVIPQIPNLAAKFDILFVNSFGLPFNTGAIFFALVVIVGIFLLLRYAVRKGNYVLHTATLAVCMIILGYTSYTMVLIRANANPSINMSNPKDLIGLLSYLNREQYGDRPLAYGPVYTARPVDVDWNGGEMRYWKGEKRYEELGRKPEVKYNSSDKMLFPRVWDNDDPGHVKFYESWLDLPEGQKPTMGDNIKFFVTYQINYMYWRYFLWNFAGRQNDVQGSSNNVQAGNWISGILPFDNMRLGPQDNLPPSMNSKAKNKFYLLPLILGLVGLFYHFRRLKTDAWVVLLLFFFTGLAIVFYLNQTPLQPRERDYAYAGSFYAYCIWIGIGVMAVWDWMRKKMDPKIAAGVASIACLLVPTIMGAQGWDDHDRSDRYVARDMGKNYLESCAPNAILFTQGDNDTYPLWYAQEVEGIRPDVRIVNLSLLGVDWYIDEMKNKINDAAAVPLSLPADAYRGSKRDVTRFYKNPQINQDQYYNLEDVFKFMTTEDQSKMIRPYGDQYENYLPARNLFIPVDKQTVLSNGTVQPEDQAKVVDQVQWTINRTTLLKPSLMVLDIIQNNKWKRPIYFAISVNQTEYLGLNDYLQQEGLTYRLVPIKNQEKDGLPGFVQPTLMYNNVMKKFAWGNVDKEDLYMDENVLRMVSNLRSNFARLATSLIRNGQNQKAIEVLDKCQQVLPERNVPTSLLMLPVAQSYYQAGAPDKGKEILKKLINWYKANMEYYTSLNDDYRGYYKRDMNEAVYVFSQITELADKSKDTELTNLAKPLFEKYRPFYTFDNPQGGSEEEE